MVGVCRSVVQLNGLLKSPRRLVEPPQLSPGTGSVAMVDGILWLELDSLLKHLQRHLTVAPFLRELAQLVVESCVPGRRAQALFESLLRLVNLPLHSMELSNLPRKVRLPRCQVHRPAILSERLVDILTGLGNSAQLGPDFRIIVVEL